MLDPAMPLTLPVVVGAALVDSLNPCAFALLLVFISTVLTMIARQGDTRSVAAARRWFLTRGGVYVLGIFLTYLALGFGLMGALSLTQSFSSTHLISRLAAIVALGLGLLAFQEALVPELGSRLSAHVDVASLRTRVGGLSLPALFGAGILVGLCTVPCSGAVYLAVLALLTAQASLVTGVTYLVLYNVVFVLPLFLLLGLASSPVLYRQMARWQLRQRALLKLGTGAVAIAVGLLTLLVV